MGKVRRVTIEVKAGTSRTEENEARNEPAKKRVKVVVNLADQETSATTASQKVVAGSFVVYDPEMQPKEEVKPGPSGSNGRVLNPFERLKTRLLIARTVMNSERLRRRLLNQNEQAKRPGRAEGIKLKEDCLQFMREQVTIDDMWKVRRELEELIKEKNYVNFAQYCPLAAIILQEAFCQPID